mmetsp:Transcript_108254/g.337360  ORF Transcript_108254/g.337360 Transcript_108254/m.337360 type:complete len:217 (-) Transcript_108254:944-1594(-)
MARPGQRLPLHLSGRVGATRLEERRARVLDQQEGEVVERPGHAHRAPGGRGPVAGAAGGARHAERGWPCADCRWLWSSALSQVVEVATASASVEDVQEIDRVSRGYEDDARPILLGDDCALRLQPLRLHRDDTYPGPRRGGRGGRGGCVLFGCADLLLLTFPDHYNGQLVRHCKARDPDERGVVSLLRALHCLLLLDNDLDPYCCCVRQRHLRNDR